TAVTISTEGTTYFRYESTDNAGNVQTTVSRAIKIDTANPTVNVGDDQSKNSQFTQTSDDSDAESGIASYLWTQTSGPGTIIFGSAALSDTVITADMAGTYVITLTVTDGAGNSVSDSFTLTWTNPVSGSGGGGSGGRGGGGSAISIGLGSGGPSFHNECQNNQCMIVSGAGSNQCVADSQCTGTSAPVSNQILQQLGQQ